MKKQKYSELQNLIDPILKAQWESEQQLYRSKIIQENHIPAEINIIAGVDITFSTICPDIAVSTLYILTGDNKPIGCMNRINQINVPYVPGFLAFREVDTVKDLINDYLQFKRLENHNFTIDVIFVDGNGILHPNQCGLASHLGVVIDTPTIGCAKKIFAIDGINKDITDQIKQKFKGMGKKTCFEYLIGDSGKIWGAAVKNCTDAYDPLIVSIGHKVDIDTAINLTIKYSVSRVVEPVRLADKHSRFIIGQFDKFYAKNKDGMGLVEIVKEFQEVIEAKYNKL